MSVLLEQVVKELAVVSAKLDAESVHARRLKLLRRQAALGDVRDAIRKADARALSARP